ncbi:hypothetical protein [Raoultella ornithinolytica]|uniref:hypothetical protein n=1 Tax=Raoultella ornithinolytica TaxID=54291 RepID=UPI001BD34DDE|nr:hypothetical protein [Raoultella ornithinolytica]MCX3408826.1 hypothetical protein [Raoultella ornithinolytica]
MSKKLYIELGDTYVVTGSAQDLILSEKKAVTDEKSKNFGNETLSRIGYYSKFEHLVKELRDYIFALGEKLSKAVEL